MSAHAYKANQLRLLLAAFAYVLIDGIRRVALKKTTLAKAVPNTIRLKLLKVGAKVINSGATHQALPARCLPLQRPVLQGPRRPGAPIIATLHRNREKGATLRRR